MSPEARMELDRSRIRRESRERDREFTPHRTSGRDFAWGVIVTAAAFGLYLYLAVRHG